MKRRHTPFHRITACALLLSAPATLGQERRLQIVEEVSLGELPKAHQEIITSPRLDRLATFVLNRTAGRAFKENLAQGAAWQMFWLGPMPKTSRQGHVFVDGELSERSFIGPLVFSPDGRRFAYFAAARDADATTDGKEKVGWWVVDGVEGRRFDPVPGSYAFSPDNRQFAYFAWRQEKLFLVVEGEEHPLSYKIATHLVYNPNGSGLAFAASDGEAWFVVIDGEEGTKYTAVSEPRFSADGNRIAYIGWKGERFDSPRVLVVDGEAQRFPAVVQMVPRGLATPQIFSPDSRQVAYWAYDDELKSRFLVVDGERRAEDNSKRLGKRAEFVFGMDGKVAFSRNVEGRQAGGRKSAKTLTGVVSYGDTEYSHRDALVFGLSISTDGRLGYAARRDRLLYSVIDGEETETGIETGNMFSFQLSLPFWRLTAPMFSPSGRHAAFVSNPVDRHGKKTSDLQIVIDGVRSTGLGRIDRMRWLDDETLRVVAHRGNEYFRFDLRAPE